MKKALNKIISIVIVLSLLLTVAPFSAFTVESYAYSDSSYDIPDIVVDDSEKEKEFEVLNNYAENPIDQWEELEDLPVYSSPEFNDEDDEIGAVCSALTDLGAETDLEIPDDILSEIETYLIEADEAGVLQEVLMLTENVLAETVNYEDFEKGVAPVDPNDVEAVNAAFSAFYDGLSFDGVGGAILDFVKKIGGAVYRLIVEIIYIIFPPGNRKVGAITYDIDNKSGKATVVNIDDDVAAISIPEHIPGTQHEVVGIAKGALSGRDKKISVLNIPKTITQLDSGVFANNNSLVYVTFEGNIGTISDRLFYNCSKLKSVAFLEGTPHTIGNSAFESCEELRYSTGLRFETPEEGYLSSELNKIPTYSDLEKGIKEQTLFIIPNTVKTICKDAFKDCKNLGSCIISSGEPTYYDFSVPSSVTVMGTSVFQNCESLQRVIFNAKVSQVPFECFSGCKNLKTVTICNSVKVIGISAFRNDVMLNNVIFEGTPLTEICSTAFENCKDLEKITLPKTLQKIRYQAFAKTGLSDIYIPASVTTLGTFLGQAGNIFSDCKSLTKVTGGENVTFIPEETFMNCEKLESVAFTGIKQIDEKAFKYCRNLKSVNLSKVTTINSHAFYDCDAISSITVPSPISIGEKAFAGCDCLESIEYTKVNTTVEVTGSIGSSAFLNCANLKKINGFDSRISSIGDKAFKGCKKLNDVNLGFELKIIGDYAFADCFSVLDENIQEPEITIPDKVTNIGANAFSKCTELKTVGLGSSITTIGINAFSECSALETIVVPDSVTSLGASAFYKCTALSSVKLGSKIEEIKDWTFGLCENLIEVNPNPNKDLSQVNIPSAVTRIGVSAFRYCAALPELTLNAKLQTIDAGAFNGCKSLGTVEFPSSLVTIGNRAFYNCLSLTELNLTGTSVNTIGAQAFTYCNALESITLPNSLENISTSLTFNNCENLTSVTLGNGIPRINNYMFYGCESLPEITFGDNIISLGAKAFSRCDSLYRVNIGKISNVASDAFLECLSLETIEADAENEKYTSFDGVLYNKDKTVLIICPTGKTGDLVLPETVEKINGYAFYKALITNVTFKSSLKEIGAFAFAQCPHLRNIEVSMGHENNIEHIGDSAFEFCTNATGNIVGKKIEYIGRRAFYKCMNMFDGYTVRIPENTTVKSNAFAKCTKIVKAINYSNKVEDGAFDKEVEFFVPEKTSLTGEVLVYGHPGSGGTLSVVLANGPEDAEYKCQWYYIVENKVEKEVEVVVEDTTITKIETVKETHTVEIEGATDESYVITNDDFLKKIAVKITGVNEFTGTKESKVIDVVNMYEKPTMVPRNGSPAEIDGDYIIGILPNSNRITDYFKVVNGKFAYERAKTGAYVRLMSGNAITKEYKMVIHGDVNMDGNVTEDDVKMIGLYTDGEMAFNEIQRKAADVNKDKLVNDVDIEYLRENEMVNKEPEYFNVKFIGDYEIEKRVRKNSKVILPVCQKAGCSYEFYCDGEVFDAKKAITKDITVKVVLVEGIKIVSSRNAIDMGKTVKFTAQTAANGTAVDVEWTSLNTKVAEVQPDGTVVGISEGTATIKAVDSEGRTATKKVTVYGARVEINPLTDTDVKIGLFSSYSSAKTLLDYSAYNCTGAVRFEWSSNNKNVKVDKNGTVTYTGNLSRTAVITLTAYDANSRALASDSITVRVYKVEALANTLNKLFGKFGF